MFSPKKIKNTKILDAVVLTADRTSDVIDIGEAVGLSVHAIWTGTPAGTVKIQGSNDSINFVDIDTQSAGGAAGQKLFNLANQMYAYARVSYVFASSTGTLTAYICLKS
jgi:hypothetical protein